MSAGVETHYIFDLNGQLIAEANAQGNILKEYVYFEGQPLAQIIGDEIYYYHNSHLGTPEMMTDASQNIVWQASYTPFGKATVEVSTIENNIRFPGQYYDAETGLHYNYFRDYDPEIGRYIQSDPIGLAGGINTYGYVGGNPVNYIDPYGLDRWSGTVFSTDAFIGKYFQYTLYSEYCDNGRRAMIEFEVYALSLGIGSPVNIGGSSVSIEDRGAIYRGENIFDGTYASLSWGASFGGGVGGSITGFNGSANGSSDNLVVESSGAMGGLNWSADFDIGFSSVTNSGFVKCSCE